MKYIKKKTYRLKNFFKEDIWEMELEELSKAKARFVKYAKVAIITAKTYAQQKIGPQAVALSYLSVMALVPFLAIVFAITGGLGIDGLLKDFMYSNFSSSQGVIDTVLSFSQNIIDTARSGWMGFLNALLFLWIIYRLMAGVESAFNNVWKVNGNRSLVRRLSYYLLILILSPFVILVLFSGSFVYTNLLEYMGLNIEELSFIKKFLSWILFVAVAALTYILLWLLT